MTLNLAATMNMTTKTKSTRYTHECLYQINQKKEQERGPALLSFSVRKKSVLPTFRRSCSICVQRALLWTSVTLLLLDPLEEGEIRLPHLPSGSPPPEEDWAPCIRAIVSDSEKLQKGTLFIITQDGANIGRLLYSHSHTHSHTHHCIIFPPCQSYIL